MIDVETKPVVAPHVGPSRAVWWSIWVCWLIGIAITLLLVWEGQQLSEAAREQAATGLPGCGPGEPCDHVLQSPYARVLGISLTKWSLLFYAVTAAVLLISAYAWQLSLAPPLSLMVPVVTFAGVTAAAWCLVIMVFVLKQVCYYCTALHLINAILFGLTVVYARQDWRLRQLYRERAAVPPLPSTPVAIHTLLAVLIATMQVLVMSVFHDEFPSDDAAVAWDGNVLGVRKLSASPLELLAVDARPTASTAAVSKGSDGQPDSQIWTSEGPRDAPHTMAVFSCPTCPKCARLNRVLRALAERYPRGIRIDIRFWPLWHSCNDSITKGGVDSRHRDACILVRYALAVAAVNPEEFPGFLDWMYEQGDKLTEALAEVEARTRVDGARFQAALDSVAVWQRFEQDMRLARRFGLRSVPQVFIEHGQIFGGISEASLEQLLVDEFAWEPADGTASQSSEEVWVAQDLLEQKAQAAVALKNQGRYAEAADAFRSIMRMKGDAIPVAMRLAWLLATCPDADVRNGEEAVYYAQLARQMANKGAKTPKGAASLRRVRPQLVDTLAAAHAEAGDFETAQELATKAVDLYLDAQRKEEADQAHERLELYQRREAYRE